MWGPKLQKNQTTKENCSQSSRKSDLLSEKYEEQKNNIQQLINDNENYFQEIKTWTIPLSRLQDNQNTRKEQNNQLAQGAQNFVDCVLL